MSFEPKVEIFVEKLGLDGVSPEQIEDAKNLSQKRSITLVDALVNLEALPETQLMKLAAESAGVEFRDLTEVAVSPELSHLMPEKIARKYNAIAISPEEDRVCVITTDPLNNELKEALQTFIEKEVEYCLGIEKDILEAIDGIYGKKEAEAVAGGGGGFDLEDGDELDDDLDTELDMLIADKDESGAPIVKIVNLILMDSLKKGASDIHIEPFEKNVRVRYRIDGHLVDAFTLPKKQQGPLTARMKIISNLDITENRVPQDGRFKMKIAEKEVDYRVSILPVIYGGKIVLRSLDKSNLKVELSELGFSDRSMENFETAIQKPFGMIIVTGPTGSGKSTTLYSVLSELNSVERNLITVEDPIEYQIEGITQVQAKAEIGMTFANALKAILRQSPDVVMIGEIRDGETADIAVKAALTGQIVLSTLHTNDAPSAVVRLKDMGVEPFLISSSLSLVAAQRLCRKVCPNCKEPDTVSEEELKSLGYSERIEKLVGGKPEFSKGTGCAKCGRSGCKGRVAITETLLLDGNMQSMIERGCSAQELKEYAVQQGLLTLRDDALYKFALGEIPVDEVVRVTTAD